MPVGSFAMVHDPNPAVRLVWSRFLPVVCMMRRNVGFHAVVVVGASRSCGIHLRRE